MYYTFQAYNIREPSQDGVAHPLRVRRGRGRHDLRLRDRAR